MSATPVLTVVVCTHNREAYLPACIESLRRQTLPRDDYEILVVDNASTDSTAALCRAWEAEGLIRYVFEPVPGLSQARNTGWQNARGRYVGYLDDDGQAAPGWLAAARDAFVLQQPEPGWVGGPIELDWNAPPPDWLDTELQECLGRLDWGDTARWLTPRERLGGGNSFYPRAVLEASGGFDTRLGRKKNLLLSGEETQLQRRLEAAGHRLFYHPGVRMLHAVPEERLRPDFFQRRYYWGGITDELIRRSLAGLPAAPPLPSAAVTGHAGPVHSALRLIRNAVAAAGFAGQTRRIRGRIYWSYVWGRLVGAWRWQTDAELRKTARELTAV
ncbi:MAG TPA: glycosyltransferase [Kiritimatiellia bacterium]|nr:glycosyltransferase [Kiritimatiellia bacterium]